MQFDPVFLGRWTDFGEGAAAKFLKTKCRRLHIHRAILGDYRIGPRMERTEENWLFPCKNSGFCPMNPYRRKSSNFSSSMLERPCRNGCKAPSQNDRDVFEPEPVGGWIDLQSSFD
jgi:hypothetical protein